MGDAQGFWSYVHADDAAEAGRIVDLARDIVAQYELLTGQSIQLFLDKDSIELGDAWQSVLDGALASVAFFIAVITPRYFQSSECRRELQAFARRATDLGVRELVMPLLYVDVADLHTDNPADELVRLIKGFQWEDWTEVGLEDRSSASYRKGVRRLATRLAEANRLADQVDMTESVAGLEASPDDEAEDEAGLIDKMADFEEAMPRWGETVQGIGLEIEAIGGLMEKATEDIERADAQGKGFAARVAIARRVANDLRPRSEAIFASSQVFTSQLHAVDQGVRLLIEHGPAEAAEDSQAQEDLCGFFHSVRQFALSARDALASTQMMVDAVSPIEGMSRDLRQPIRTLKQGLTVLVEGQEVILEWVSLMDEAPVDCSGWSLPTDIESP